MPANKRPQTPRPELRSSRTVWEYNTFESSAPFGASALNTFGAVGWELVSVYVDGRPGRDPMFYAVFKREAP